MGNFLPGINLLARAMSLSPDAVFAERWIGIILCVTEKDGQACVRLGAQGGTRNQFHQRGAV
jgi:hypothetical protein